MTDNAADSTRDGPTDWPIDGPTDWPIDDLDDWPFDDPSIDVAALHKSLLESEADVAAGRTFSEKDIRARFGLPRSDAD